MRILLVNPWITDFAAFDLWAKPLGLLTAGAFLAARGHEVRLVDCTHRFQGVHGYIGDERRLFGTGKFLREPIPRPDCLSNVRRLWCRYGIPVGFFDDLVTTGPRPDIVLVTCVMTYWYPGAFDAIARIRMLLPGVPVALGGIYARLHTSHAREKSGADAVITEALPSRIVDAVESLAGAYGDGAVPGDAFARWPDPLWGLYECLPSAVVMTSRGCPMCCTVCASHVLADTFERRDPLDAARSIISLADKGVRDIAFADDALLFGPEDHAIPLFETLAREGAPVRLHTPNGLHVRAITPLVARLMRRAGVKTVRLSLETSSDEEARERFSSKTGRDEFARAAASLLDAGFSPDDIGSYVLVGLPGQSPESVYETVDFSLSHGVKVRPALFSPVPGTVEYNRAVESGMMAPDTDPLLENNTLRTLDLWGGGADVYLSFRRFVTDGNARLDSLGRA